jgi:serine/threonine protein kinase
MLKASSNYRLGKPIGRGGFGFVYEGYRVSDNQALAIKAIRRNSVPEWTTNDNRNVPLEVVTLRRAQAVAGVVRFYEYFEDAQEIALVMERVSGVDLFEYVSKYIIREDEARQIFTQLVRTVVGCKHCDIVHRDIKDENIIYDVQTGRTTLVDFGCASIIPSGDAPLDRFRGTKDYAPPEWITSRKYTAEANTVWQLGTCLYSMLQAQIPFDNDSEIAQGCLRWHRTVSSKCTDLITGCLQVNPVQRLSLAQVAEHSWVVGEISKFTGE